MFPKGIGFFIAILLIDMVLGSLKGKKGKEDNQQREAPQPNVSTSRKDGLWGSYKEEMAKLRKRETQTQGQKMFKEDSKKEKVSNLQEEPSNFSKREDYTKEDSIFEIDDIIGKTEKENRRKYSKKELKTDLLKGIIFSEILSEPKSIQNRRKSI